MHLKHKHAAPGQTPPGTAQTAVQQTHRHACPGKAQTACSRRVTLPKAAQAVVKQTSPEAAQADVE